MSPTAVVRIDLRSLVDVLKVQLRDAMLRIAEEKLAVFEGSLFLVVSLEIAEHGSVCVRVHHHSFISTSAAMSVLGAGLRLKTNIYGVIHLGRSDYYVARYIAANGSNHLPPT